MTIEERAHLLVASIRAAMKNGCQHRDAAGKDLTDVRDIVTAMLSSEGVMVDERERVQVTTVAAELEAVGYGDLAGRVRALEDQIG